MKNNRRNFPTRIPDRQQSQTAAPPAIAHAHPGGCSAKVKIPLRVKGFLAACAVLCCLLIPTETLSFDFGQMLNNAVKSIEKNIPGKFNKNSETAKKVYQQEKLTNREVQQRLNSLGYNVGPADGVLGPMSVKAIKAFQRDHGMAQTGLVSPGLLAELKSAGSKSATALSSKSKRSMVASTAQSQGIKVGGSLKVQVHEELLGPNVNNLSGSGVFVSEDGGHVAIAMRKGSRQVVMVDGVEGPVFDEVIPFHTQFAFAGRRFAYVGRRGKDLIGIVDGREVGRIGPNDANLVLKLKTAPIRLFHFSADGSRLAYLVLSGTGNQSSGGYYAGATQPQWGPVYMVVDGKRSPAYAAVDMNQIIFGGNRLAYAARTADQKWHVVIDGKPGPAYLGIRALRLSKDGAHYAFIGKRDWGHEVVVVDGKEGKARPDDNSANAGIEALSITANGHVAYRAQAVDPTRPRGNILVMDRKEITREAVNFRFEHTALLHQPTLGQGKLNSWWFALSPDGQRIAYVKKTSGGHATVIDGKSGFEYDKIFDLQFSPDSRRVAYIGQKGLFTFVVVDGKESPTYQKVSEFLFSADSRHYAFEAIRPNEMAHFVVVDGQAGPVLSAQKMTLVEKSFLFSPNGEHFAYAGNETYPGHNPTWALIYDGELHLNQGRLEKFVKRNVSGPNVNNPALAISPDDGRIAYTIIPPNERKGRQHLMVGNQAYPPFNSYSFATFSPNGRHFAVVAWSLQAKKQVILVDGKEGPAYDEIVQPYRNFTTAVSMNQMQQMQRTNDACFRFLDDQTLRFLAVKDGSVLRVTIDVGG